MALSFNGSDLFGFDTIQQQQLKKLVKFLEDAQAAGQTDFPYIPQTLFFGFDVAQTYTLIAALAWAWANPVTVSTISQTILAGGFENEQIETLTKLTRAVTDDGVGGTPATMTAYARVRFTETWGSPVVNIAELQIMNQVGTLLAGTPIYSSIGGALTGADNAFDAGTTTIWAPTLGDISQSIGLFLTTPAVVKSVAIRYASADGFSFEEAPRSFVVEFSDDGEAWTTALTVTDEAIWSQSEIRTYTLP